jgi:membrane fusion protein, heavy metal efflux system
MTNPRADNQLGPAAEQVHAPAGAAHPRSLWQRFSLVVQLTLSVGLVAGAFAYVLWSGNRTSAPEKESRPTRQEEAVQVVGPTLIRVRPGTPVESKLQIATVESAWLTAPVLPVTGTALASLRPGDEAAQDTWQFATSDLLSAFSDWQRAVKDVTFQETQLKAIRELNVAKIDAQKKVVERMEKLVAAKTDTEKDLAAERTNLIQFEIQGRKDIHDQEQAVYLSRRTEATLARQLQQAGLEPTMLRSAAAEGEIIVAEVPERMMGRVKLDMTCEVRFFALPGRVYTGRVSSISPVISKDKRVLNVQFTVKDPEHLIRPGMFADIGLGTDKRQALLMPADGVLHVGDKDYALVGTEPGVWKITEVQVGQVRGLNVEVLDGLKGGERVVGKGAILLTPVVSQALQAPALNYSAVNSSGEPGAKN